MGKITTPEEEFKRNFKRARIRPIVLPRCAYCTRLAAYYLETEREETGEWVEVPACEEHAAKCRRFIEERKQ